MFGAPNLSVKAFATALTCSMARTSSARHCAALRPVNFVASRSVATTTAPSLMNISAIARPMPCPAAVISAFLFCNRPLMARSLMVVPGNALLGDMLIFHRRLEHHPVGKLIDHRSLNFLPRGLALRIMKAALPFEFGAALGELGARNQDVRGAFAQIDPHAVAGLQQRETASGSGLR